MARHAAAFIDALGLKQIDLLGFSLGGLVAQQLTLDRPKLVRRLVLVGTGPRSGEGMATLTPEAKAIFGKTYAVPDELWLEVFFSPTETSQAAGLIMNGSNDVYTVNSFILQQNLPNAQLILSLILITDRNTHFQNCLWSMSRCSWGDRRSGGHARH